MTNNAIGSIAAAIESPAPPTEANFRDLFKPLERARYMMWKLSRPEKPFRGRMKDGTVINIRPVPTNDYGTAYEIFFLHVYRPPLEPASVRFILDLGGNVGYSCLYWAQNYPNAKVVVCEPHPVHCNILEGHLRDNGFVNAVTLKRAAAAGSAGEVMFVDADDASCIITGMEAYPAHLMRNFRPGFPVIRVPRLDVFKLVGTETVDILKMDIEGSEYEIMTDPRFEEFASRTRCVMMEWHEQMPDHLGAEWCRDRLASLGFDAEIERRAGVTDAGILRAVRN